LPSLLPRLANIFWIPKFNGGRGCPVESVLPTIINSRHHAHARHARLSRRCVPVQSAEPMRSRSVGTDWQGCRSMQRGAGGTSEWVHQAQPVPVWPATVRAKCKEHWTWLVGTGLSNNNNDNYTLPVTLQHACANGQSDYCQPKGVNDKFRELTSMTMIDFTKKKANTRDTMIMQ